MGAMGDERPELVAAMDGKRGCPVELWDLYWYRCNLGRDTCAYHGKFETRIADEVTGVSPA